MMKYINMRGPYHAGVETVDQFETYKEARAMLAEYRLSDPYNNYYISSRSTREWRES